MRVKVNRRGIGGLDVCIYKIQDVCHCFVKVSRVKRAVLDPVKDPFPTDRRVARHFKV